MLRQVAIEELDNPIPFGLHHWGEYLDSGKEIKYFHPIEKAIETLKWLDKVNKINLEYAIDYIDDQKFLFTTRQMLRNLRKNGGSYITNDDSFRDKNLSPDYI